MASEKINPVLEHYFGDQHLCLRATVRGGTFPESQIISESPDLIRFACGVWGCNAACVVIDANTPAPKVRPLIAFEQPWYLDDCVK